MVGKHTRFRKSDMPQATIQRVRKQKDLHKGWQYKKQKCYLIYIYLHIDVIWSRSTCIFFHWYALLKKVSHCFAGEEVVSICDF